MGINQDIDNYHFRVDEIVFRLRNSDFGLSYAGGPAVRFEQVCMLFVCVIFVPKYLAQAERSGLPVGKCTGVTQ